MTRTPSALAAAMLAATAFAASSAHATVVVDHRHDILPTFNATNEPIRDLDVIRVDARFTDKDILLSATMDGAIGTNEEGFYVWGIDRGAGTELLANANPTKLTDATPPVGQGVPFDTFITMRNDGTSDIVFLGPVDRVTHPDDTIPVTDFIPLAPHAFTVSGNTISIRLSRDLFASQGFDFTDFRYNFWSRYRDILTNPTIADFAPDDSTFTASQAVPEPAAWALMIAGFGLAGARLRSSRRQLA